jgi:hypothetical protein
VLLPKADATGLAPKAVGVGPSGGA